MKYIRALVLAALCLPILTVSFMASAEEFEIQTRQVDDWKAVFATVESVDHIVARTRIGGTIKKLNIDEGSEVAAGQKIAVISDKKLPLSLASIDAKLKSLVARQVLANTDLVRARSLRKTGALSQARLDESQAKLDIAKSDIASLKAERSIILQQMADGDVRAPAAGRVLSVALTNGSVVLPGETVATIARDTFILRLRLPERHARFLNVGDQVQVGQRGMGHGEQALTGATVQKVYPAMEKGRVIADVKVAGLGDYFVGERTRVHVATGTREIFAAPAQYFYQRHGITFAKLKAGGEITVRLGLPLKGDGVDETEVLSGLKAGDILVTP
jgi:membrane fusion protein, multidrug efflux system